MSEGCPFFLDERLTEFLKILLPADVLWLLLMALNTIS